MRETEFTYEAHILGTYKSERARGIMHTPAWQEEMKKLQDRFNDPNDGLLLKNNPGAIPFWGI